MFQRAITGITMTPLKPGLKVKTLPATITIEKTPRYTVYYSGADVWKDNAAHMKRYKVKDNGELKEKKPEKDDNNKQ
jgi:hypothetical protein